MEVAGGSPVLLLDLDGVVVFEERSGAGRPREILVLHRALGAALAAARLPTIVLTHRSRREAVQILRAADLPPERLLGVIAAEQLFLAGLRHLRFGRLMRAGLEKALALEAAERLSGVPRRRMAIIDDRQHNLSALLKAGIGLALMAPSALSPDGRVLTTFDLAEALATVDAWSRASTPPRQAALRAEEHPVDAWRRSGLDTARLERHLFNRLRRLAYRARNGLARSRRGSGG